jgi:hypothetical protein
MFSTPVWPTLNDLLQSYIQVLQSISSPNCTTSLVRISAYLAFSLVRNLTTMCCTTAKGTTCSLSMITTDKKQVDMQGYVIMAISISSLTTNKVILFYIGISLLEKNIQFIFQLFSYIRTTVETMLLNSLRLKLTKFLTLMSFSGKTLQF